MPWAVKEVLMNKMQTINSQRVSKNNQFCYLVSGEHWCNNWDADAYSPGNFGADNCVVNTQIGAK